MSGLLKQSIEEAKTKRMARPAASALFSSLTGGDVDIEDKFVRCLKLYEIDGQATQMPDGNNNGRGEVAETSLRVLLSSLLTESTVEGLTSAGYLTPVIDPTDTVTTVPTDTLKIYRT